MMPRNTVVINMMIVIFFIISLWTNDEISTNINWTDTTNVNAAILDRNHASTLTINRMSFPFILSIMEDIYTVSIIYDVTV